MNEGTVTYKKLVLTAQILETLIFQGPVMKALGGLLPRSPLQAILQQESEKSMNALISCVKEILPLAQDDLVDEETYAEQLANYITYARSIIRSEHERQQAEKELSSSGTERRSTGIFRRKNQ